MIKTAIIIERIDISLGGAERSVSELATELGKAGVEVTILAAKGNYQSQFTKVLCKDHPGKRTPLKIFAQALEKYFAENEYDIIHSTLPFDFADIYQPRGGSYLEAMIRNADSYENSLVRNFKKATHFTNLKRYEMVRAERKVCDPSNKTIIAALSQYVAGQFKRHYNISSQRIRTIANAVNIEKVPDREDSARLRNEWLDELDAGEPSNAAVFLFGANNLRLKGLRSLLKAVEMLKAGDLARQAYVIVAGSGKIAKYKRLAKSLGVSENVLFAGPVDNMADAFAACDVVVLPSFYDPCSRFILEGLAAGKPAITTRFNGACEAYVNGRHGKIIDDGSDAEAIADAMAYFSVKENVENAAAAIKEDGLREKISIERHGREMIELYKEIIARRNK